jgi:hypothetical protein
MAKIGRASKVKVYDAVSGVFKRYEHANGQPITDAPVVAEANCKPAVMGADNTLTLGDTDCKILEIIMGE